MKFVLMALAGLLLLGGGAAGAYFFFDKPAEAAAGPADEAQEAHKAKKADHGGGHGEGADVQYVEMQPLVLPIIDDNGVSQVVSLVMVLEVNDVGTAGEVRRLEPRLKDAYLQDMYGVLNKEAAMGDGGVVEVAKIKARLNKVTERVLGKGVVNDVLLQVVQQRPI